MIEWINEILIYSCNGNPNLKKWKFKTIQNSSNPSIKFKTELKLKVKAKAFVMLSGFCPISKNPPTHPCFL